MIRLVLDFRPSRMALIMGEENNIGCSSGFDIKMQPLCFPLSSLTSGYHVGDVRIVVFEELLPDREIPDYATFEFPDFLVIVLERDDEINLVPADDVSIQAAEVVNMLALNFFDLAYADEQIDVPSKIRLPD